MSKLQKLEEQEQRNYEEIQDAYRSKNDLDPAVEVARWNGHPAELSRAVNAQTQNDKLIFQLERKERELHRLIRLEKARLDPKPDAPGQGDDTGTRKPKRPSLADDFTPEL